MSTSLCEILNSISTCQNPTLFLETQPEASFYEKPPCPYRDHLTLLVPPPSLGTKMFIYSVGQVAFCPGL